MECTINARIIDSISKSLEIKGEQVPYNLITVVDEDAFMDKDRYFSIWMRADRSENIDKLVGKTCNFLGILTKNKGEVKFRAEDISISE